MQEPSEKINEIPAISVENCSVAFGDNVVLDNVSFSVPQGSVTALIGPNGSGKTTLIRAILGLTSIRYGEIRIFGKHLHAVRGLIGYVPQRFDFDRSFPITVREFMDLARHRHSPLARIEEKIKEVDLSPLMLDSHLGSLSGGELQRVLIAQAIINNPSILLLDEPSSGIDIIGEATFYEVIKHLNVEHKTTVLIVSHDIAVVSDLVDEVICINKKLLCFGPPKTALSEKKLSELFGSHVNIYEHRGHGEHRE